MSLAKTVIGCLVGFILASNSAHADVSEFDNCSNIPQEVLIKKEPHDTYFWVDVVKRFEKYGAGPFVAYPKNPEEVLTAGPAHGRNCTPGQLYYGTQVLQFRLKTVNYFGTPGVPGSGVSGGGGHLPVLARSYVKRWNNVDDGWQIGRGLALFKPYQVTGGSPGGHEGVMVEHFGPGYGATEITKLDNQGSPFFLEDATWYSVTLHVHWYGMGYTITNESTGRYLAGYFADSGPSTFDFGYAIAAICYDDDCQTVPRFEIHVKDLSVSWFCTPGAVC